MDLRTIDLNLLVVFDAMMDCRSVTRAGEMVRLSQPAMSAAVARLRALFDDPLFVRTGTEMKPTPRALELAGPIKRVMEMIRGEVLQRSGFVPATTDRIFTIVTPDIGEIHFLPRLMGCLAREAPSARLRTIARPKLAAAETMESGAAALAIGYFPDLQKAGFYQQKLFDNPHVCIARRGHPTVGPGMTLDEYLAASHAVVRPDGREHVFEQYLQERGLRRKVLVEMSHFMSLLPVIESSDLVAAVPSDLANLCSRYTDLHILDIPVEAPVISIHQFWHARFHKDPANIWLRGVVRSLFTEGGDEVLVPAAPEA